MDNLKRIGIVLIIVGVIVGIFGYWLKSYNDSIAQVQLNETGTCYLPNGTCLHATSDSIFYVTTAIAIFLVALGTYLILMKGGPHTTKKIESVIEKKPIAETGKLSPELRQIYDVIIQSNGAILQGEIVSKSGMDKVKVSRLLDKLEMLGMIERRRHGMSNLVVVKKG